MTIQYPWALLFLLAIPLVLLLRIKYATRTGFSRVSVLGQNLQPSAVKRYGGYVLAALVMALIVLAIANIQYSSYWQKSYLESKWIMLVQDLSGSMGRPGDERGRITLGDVALEGAHEFIDMRQKDDLIGIIAFSSFAQLIAPPSFDKEILTRKLELLSRKQDSLIFRQLTVGGATNASYAAWLAVCVFFMLLPEENQPSYEQVNDLQRELMGRSMRKIPIPAKLENINFGQGMAVVLFTDGRIEANKSDDDVKKGLLNFVNVVELIKKLDIKLYIIVVGGDVNSEVRLALEGPEGRSSAGRIFYMPRTFDRKKITEVYNKINEMEKNRLVVKMFKRKKDTRWVLAAAALGMLAVYGCAQVLPFMRTV